MQSNASIVLRQEKKPFLTHENAAPILKGKKVVQSLTCLIYYAGRLGFKDSLFLGGNIWFPFLQKSLALEKFS